MRVGYESCADILSHTEGVGIEGGIMSVAAVIEKQMEAGIGASRGVVHIDPSTVNHQLGEGRQYMSPPVAREFKGEIEEVVMARPQETNEFSPPRSQAIRLGGRGLSHRHHSRLRV